MAGTTSPRRADEGQGALSAIRWPPSTPPDRRATTAISSQRAFHDGPRTKATEAPSQIGALPDGVGLAVGASVPAVTVHDASGAAVALHELVARGPTLLVFYRGGWCPYCNFQIRELTERAADFQKRGVTPVAISVDQIDTTARTQATCTIPFPLLADPDLPAHEAFRVVHHADEAEVERLRGYGIDIEASSGRDHHRFAIPSVFLVDDEGVVRWAHADRDYTVRPTPDQLLRAIDAADLN